MPGRILLPVIDGPGPFTLLAWVWLSENSFLHTCELWESEGRESEPAFFGWLQSALPYAPSPLSLKTSVQTMLVGERPTITQEATDHPLPLEQRHGITWVASPELHGQRQATYPWTSLRGDDISFLAIFPG